MVDQKMTGLTGETNDQRIVRITVPSAYGQIKEFDVRSNCKAIRTSTVLGPYCGVPIIQVVNYQDEVTSEHLKHSCISIYYRDD